MSQFNANGGNVTHQLAPNSGIYLVGPLGDATPKAIESKRINREAEKHGRIDGAKAQALDRIKYLARSGGIAGEYKITRINEIIGELESEIERIETEYFNA